MYFRIGSLDPAQNEIPLDFEINKAQPKGTSSQEQSKQEE